MEKRLYKGKKLTISLEISKPKRKTILLYAIGILLLWLYFGGMIR